MVGKKMHVKKGDTVIITTGKDKNRTGKILITLPKKDSVLVEGLNMVKKHTRARGNESGGIAEKEAGVHVSNVLLYCGKCSKGVRTRVHQLEDGNKERVCVKCGQSFDK